MLRKAALYLLFSVLSVHLGLADVEVVFYTSYGAEVKTANSDRWHMISVGQKLNLADILRIPPEMNLHLSINDDLIQLPGGREGYVEFLLEEAKAPEIKRTEVIGPRIMETDSDASKTTPPHRAKESEEEIKPLDCSHLQSLASIAEATVAEVLEEIPPPPDNEYPFRNKGYAEKIFLKLRQEIHLERAESAGQPRSAAEIWEMRKRQVVNGTEFAILYLALLKGLKIKADCRQNHPGEALVIFDSGIGANDIHTITTNDRLYLLKENQVWLPLQISDKTADFVMSWYQGGDRWR